MGIPTTAFGGSNVRNYIAIVEPAEEGGAWWISFPSLPGVISVADSPAEIVSQARDALASAVAAGASLPPSVEEGAIPPDDLADFSNPLIVLVPYSASAAV